MLGADTTFLGVIIVGFFALLSPILLSMLNSRQMRAGKEEDFKRQDEVAKKVAVAATDLAAQQKAVAETAEGAAKLLLAAQKVSIAGTDEAAKLLAEGTATPAASVVSYSSPRKMQCVTVSYPNGNRQDVLLADVPREGDRIRLNNGPTSPSLIVEHVLWVEGRPGAEPTVVLVVEATAEKE